MARITVRGPSRGSSLAFALGAFALGSAACGGAPDNAAGAGADSAPAAGAAGATPARVTSQIEVEVTGGPHAGRYTAKDTVPGCSYGVLKAGAWGNAYAPDAQDPKQLSGVQLEVPNSKAAASGTSAFWLDVSFGPILSIAGPGGTHYDVDTRDPARQTKGEGTVRVADRGSSGTVTFEAKTKEGVGLKGTINCHRVIRAGIDAPEGPRAPESG
jgi:hypothetical protein